MAKITDVQTAYYRIPLPEIMEDAKHIRNAPQARNYILAIDGKGYEHGNRKDCEDRKNRKDAEYVRGA